MNSVVPKISILTATYQSPTLLERAIMSLLAQTRQDWEMVISPDDGLCYEKFACVDQRIRLIHSTEIKSGPGAARNRALNVAAGEYIAVLDDDDVFPPNFVEKVLFSLENTDSVTVPTAYFSESGRLIREIGHMLNHLGISDFARELGSMHVIAKRKGYLQWKDGFAEDVLHTCEMIDLAGGHIPIQRETRYINVVRSGSLCNSRLDIDFAYDALLSDKSFFLSEYGRKETEGLFKYRRQVNERFNSRMDKNVGYHDFLSDDQANISSLFLNKGGLHDPS
ncbi:MAG: glycosyltransferase family 2 protein [Ottowia sp.]|nr:glycosyltransferase family 2 protein [Ottowia sp.]